MRFLIFLSAALLIAGPAPAQQYQPWNNPDSVSAGNERLQDFLGRLSTLIDAAERQRADQITKEARARAPR